MTENIMRLDLSCRLVLQHSNFFHFYSYRACWESAWKKTCIWTPNNLGYHIFKCATKNIQCIDLKTWGSQSLITELSYTLSIRGKEDPQPWPPTPTLVSSITWTKKVFLKPFMDNPAYLSTTLLAYPLSTSDETSVSRLVLFIITRLQGEGEKLPCYVLQNVESMMCCVVLGHSVVSNSLQPHGL